MRLLPLLLCLACAGCPPTPQPAQVPDAAGPFDGLVADCLTAQVAGVPTDAARACLALPTFDVCLSGLISPPATSPASVACAVRSLELGMFARRDAGASNAKTWLTAHRISFQDN